MKTAHTIFKLRATRRTRELGFLAGLLTGLGLVLALLAIFQVHFCHEKHPKISALECLRPMAEKVKGIP